MSAKDPIHPNPLLLSTGRKVLEAYSPSQFTTDASFRRFARNALRDLGSMNPIESHALLYDSLILPGNEVSGEDIKHGAPQEIRDIGIEELQLCWLDPVAVREHLGQSQFTNIGIDETYARPFLCDPHYGIAIIPHKGRWVHASFTLDWIHHRKAVIGDQIKHYIRAPSRILSDGAETAKYFWQDILDDFDSGPLDGIAPAEIKVTSMEQLQDLATHLNKALDGTQGNSRVWYRGQTSEYLAPDRNEAVKAGYLPYSNLRDASLVPSLYRNTNDFGGARLRYHKLLVDLMAWEDAAESIFGPSWVDVPLGEPFIEEEPNSFLSGIEFSSTTLAKNADGVVLGGRTRHMTQQKSSWQRGLLLQHYGCPTPFLDVTSSIDVAHWFATHRFNGNGANELFTKLKWSDTNPTNWPTIYCFILTPRFQPIVDSKKLNNGSISERASRQDCGLLGGGGLLARNYAARYIGLKVRLHPKLANQTKLGVLDLFPSAHDDPVYKELQRFESLTKSNQFPLYGA